MALTLLKTRIRRLFNPPRRAIPTRAGAFVLASPILLGVAAVTASNNLLFILLGATLGTIVLSGVLSERNLRQVQARLRAVGKAYAGEVALLEAIFEREPRQEGWRRSLSPVPKSSYGLTLRERTRGFKRKKPPEVFLTTLAMLEGAPGSAFGRRLFTARGRQQLTNFELSTVYPFGLLIKSKDLDVQMDIVVRPARVKLPKAMEELFAVSPSGHEAARRGVGLEVYGLREREDRDPLHRMHALRSLSLGKDVVIDTMGQERPVARLGILNLSGAAPEAFERTLEVAQAILTQWELRGFALSLVCADAWYEAGELGLEPLLDIIAGMSLAPDVSNNSHESALWLVPEGVDKPSEDALVVTTGGQVGTYGMITR